MQDSEIPLIRDIWGQDVFVGDLIVCKIPDYVSLIEAEVLDYVNGYIRVKPIEGDMRILIHPSNVVKKPAILRTLQLIEN
jgi:hypothetical protein